MTAGQEIMLFYLVCDESGSMGSNGGIDTINSSLPELHATLAGDPLVVDKSRLSIIAFSAEAEVTLPLSQASEVAALPGVQAGGGTSYGAAFRALRQALESDVAGLKADGYRVYRPCVFFMSDGEPTDKDWQSDYDALMRHEYRPHIIAFGVDGARPDTLRRVGSLKAFMAADGVSAGPALASIMMSIGQTVVASVSRSSGQIVLPPPPPGVIDLDEL